MTGAQGLAQVLLRIWALAQMLFSGAMLILMFSLAASGGFGLAQALSLAPSAVLLLTGVALWTYAPWFARRIAANIEAGAISVAVSADDLMATGTALIGVLLVASSLPSAVVDFVGSIEDTNRAYTGIVINPNHQMRYDLFFKTIIGFFLLFSAIRLKPLLKALRGAGISKIGDSPTDKHDPPA